MYFTYLTNKKVRLVFSAGALLSLLVGIGVVDFLTGNEISLSLFYLAPILITIWNFGTVAGIVSSLLCVLTIIITNRYSGEDPDYFSLTFLWNNIATFGFYSIVVFAVKSLKRSLDRERLLATTDPVTGLLNSRQFRKEAQREIERSRRYRRPLSIIFMDCDNFKTVNDTLGHHTGDALIRIIGYEIGKSVRINDVVSRFGGDEFVILLTETGRRYSMKHVRMLQERLMLKMKQNKWPVTFSIGIASFERPPVSVDEMIQKADSLMYIVKNNGKNGVRQKVFR